VCCQHTVAGHGVFTHWCGSQIRKRTSKSWADTLPRTQFLIHSPQETISGTFFTLNTSGFDGHRRGPRRCSDPRQVYHQRRCEANADLGSTARPKPRPRVESSDCRAFKAVFSCRPDFRGGGQTSIVLASVLLARTLKPHPTKSRAPLEKVYQESYASRHESSGLEQELTTMLKSSDRHGPLGFPAGRFPGPQGSVLLRRRRRFSVESVATNHGGAHPGVHRCGSADRGAPKNAEVMARPRGKFQIGQHLPIPLPLGGPHYVRPLGLCCTGNSPRTRPFADQLQRPSRAKGDWNRRAGMPPTSRGRDAAES